MSTVAANRPDDWILPLFVHILGAMALIGGLALAAVSLIGAWRSGSPRLTRIGFLAVFYAVLPGWILMRLGGQWIASKEGLDDDQVDLTWLNIGISSSDMGFVLLVILLALGGLAIRRIARGEGEGPRVSTRIAAGLVSVLLVAYLVAVWAMTVKPR